MRHLGAPSAPCAQRRAARAGQRRRQWAWQGLCAFHDFLGARLLTVTAHRAYWTVREVRAVPSEPSAGRKRRRFPQPCSRTLAACRDTVRGRRCALSVAFAYVFKERVQALSLPLPAIAAAGCPASLGRNRCLSRLLRLLAPRVCVP